MSKDLSSNKQSHKAIKEATSKVDIAGNRGVLNQVAVSLASVLLGALFFFGGQIIGAFLFFGILAIFGLTGNEATSAYSDNVLLQLALLCTVAFTTALAIIRFLKWRKIKVFNFLLLSKKPKLSEILGLVPIYFVYFACLIVATVLAGLFTSIDVGQAQDLGIDDPNTLQDKLVLFTMLVVVTPIYEELLFRGFLYNYLRKYGSIVISTIITSILFGIAHLEYENLNWIAAVDTFIFSIFLIYVSQKYKSLYSAIIFHAAKNAIAFYVLFVH